LHKQLPVSTDGLLIQFEDSASAAKPRRCAHWTNAERCPIAVSPFNEVIGNEEVAIS
jgi:hypothetical protein